MTELKYALEQSHLCMLIKLLHRTAIGGVDWVAGEAKRKMVENDLAEIKVNSTDRYLIVISTLWHR